MRNLHVTNTTQSHARTGTTLMEVLMSIMIMSIGVISLASLFPVSIIRGVKATNLTSGTILRYNAEALIEAFPDPMVHDPDGDGNRIEHQRRNQKYLVDPLGYYFAQSDNNTAATTFKNYFGNEGDGNRSEEIPRYNAGLPQTLADQYFSQQDNWTSLYEGIPESNTLDSLIIDAADINNGSIDFVELGDIIDSPGSEVRLLLYDNVGKQVQVRQLSIGTDILHTSDWQLSTATREIRWPAPPAALVSLPSNGRYGSLSKIRIEVRDQRYSFMLTVRHQPIGLASVDVVVFFQRNYSPEHEIIHDVENFTKEWVGPDGLSTLPGVDGFDDDDDGTTDEVDEFGWPGSDDIQRRNFRLHFNLTTAYPEKPNLKKGGFLFDHQNARWYRIQKIQNNTTTSTFADITLDQPIVQSITHVSARNGAWNEGLIVMPNIVQVYPLGNKVDPNAN